jgi:hypothetical protein
MSEQQQQSRRLEMQKQIHETNATETKAVKFSRLASARTSKALKTIRRIGNLSRTSYEHSPEQAAKIIAALKTEVEALEAKFNPATPTDFSV